MNLVTYNWVLIYFPAAAGININFALDSYEALEENGNVTVCAVIIGLTEIPVIVELATISGSAIQGNIWHLCLKLIHPEM